jgi:hypothetical protein
MRKGRKVRCPGNWEDEGEMDGEMRSVRGKRVVRESSRRNECTEIEPHDGG